MHWLRYRNKLNPHFFCFSAGEVGHRLQGLPLLHRKRPCAWWQVLRLWCLGVVPSERRGSWMMEKNMWKKYEANAGGGIWMILAAESWTCWWETCGNSGGKRHDPQATRAISMQARWVSGCLDGPAGGPGSTKVCGVSTSAQFGSMLYVCLYIYMCVYVYRVYTRVLGGILLLSPDIYVGEFGFIAANPKTI